MPGDFVCVNFYRDIKSMCLSSKSVQPFLRESLKHIHTSTQTFVFIIVSFQSTKLSARYKLILNFAINLIMIILCIQSAVGTITG